MIKRSTARRYIKALYELAGEQDKNEQIGGELHTVLDLISGSKQLEQVLENPAISPQKKLAIFEEIQSELDLDKLTDNFVKLLIRKEKIGYLEAMVEEYEDLERQRKGIAVVKVTTARSISAKTRETLKKKFEETTGKQVEFEITEDPELIGGIVARIGGTVYDGSVNNQLARIQRRLSEE